MAKDSGKPDSGGAGDGKTAGGKASESAGWGFDAVPDALRDAGKRAADLAQNPYARSLLAAGLVAAAAALAANRNTREATRRNLKSATAAAEVAADQAGKVGLAIVNAATEAVQHMLSLAGIGGAASDAKSEAKSAEPATVAPAPKTRAARAKPAAEANKPAAKPPTRAATAKVAKKPATKKAARPESAAKPAASRTRARKTS